MLVTNTKTARTKIPGLHPGMPDWPKWTRAETDRAAWHNIGKGNACPQVLFCHHDRSYHPPALFPAMLFCCSPFGATQATDESTIYNLGGVDDQSTSIPVLTTYAPCSWKWSWPSNNMPCLH